MDVYKTNDINKPKKQTIMSYSQNELKQIISDCKATLECEGYTTKMYNELYRFEQKLKNGEYLNEQIVKEIREQEELDLNIRFKNLHIATNK